MSIYQKSICRLIVVLLGPIALVSCGGTDDGTTTPPVDYASYQAQLAILQGNWSRAAITDPTTLPFSGSAVFAGVMNMTVQSTTGARAMAGAVTLTTNFAADTLAGNASNFVDIANNAMSGNLAITGGALDRGVDTSVSYVFTANIDGTLSGAGDSFLIGGDLSGSFLGPNYLGTSGVVSGFATSAFGTGYMFGDFLAEQ